MKRVLLTGATGFIGSHYLQRYGGQQVILVVRSKSRVTPDLASRAQDVIEVQEATPDKLRKLDVKCLVHLAAASGFDSSIDLMDEMLHSNVQMPSRLLEAFTQAGGDEMINIGTYWQHQKNEPNHPNSFYAASKDAFEAVINFYALERGLKAITLKLFDTYGPNDPRRRILQLIHEAATSGSPLPMTGGEQLLNLNHVHDVTDAIEHARNLFKKGHQRYLVKSGESRSLREWADLYLKVNHLRADIKWGQLPYSGRHFFQDVTVHPILPGWAPRILPEDGFRNLF